MPSRASDAGFGTTLAPEPVVEPETADVSNVRPVKGRIAGNKLGDTEVRSHVVGKVRWQREFADIQVLSDAIVESLVHGV